MLSKILSLGDRIELNKVMSEEKRQKLTDEKSIMVKTFVSQIYDIVSESDLKIAMPIVEGRVIPLPLNARFEACFFANGGLYKCRLVITDRYKEDGLYILVAEIVTDLKKYQRRQYYRLECTMDVSYVKVSDDQVLNIKEDEEVVDTILENEKKLTGIVIDISGGGIRFASSEKMEAGSSVLFILDKVNVLDLGTCKVIGQIISSRKIENHDGMFEQRAEFINISGMKREAIIRFIFEQERKMRQKM